MGRDGVDVGRGLQRRQHARIHRTVSSDAATYEATRPQKAYRLPGIINDDLIGNGRRFPGPSGVRYGHRYDRTGRVDPSDSYKRTPAAVCHRAPPVSVCGNRR